MTSCSHAAFSLTASTRHPCYSSSTYQAPLGFPIPPSSSDPHSIAAPPKGLAPILLHMLPRGDLNLRVPEVSALEETAVHTRPKPLSECLPYSRDFALPMPNKLDCLAWVSQSDVASLVSTAALTSSDLHTALCCWLLKLKSPVFCNKL